MTEGSDVRVGDKETNMASDPGAVVRSAVDMVNRRALDDAPKIIAKEFVRHDLANIFGDFYGPGGVQDFLGALLASAPDLHLEIDQLIVADDFVTLRFHSVGTHTGEPLLGVAASGARIELNGINIYQVQDGKIVETWQLSDGLNLYRSLGLLKK